MKGLPNPGIGDQVPGAGHQVISQGGKNAPGNQLGEKATHQRLYSRKAISARQRQVQSVYEECHSNKDQNTADPVQN